MIIWVLFSLSSLPSSVCAKPFISALQVQITRKRKKLRKKRPSTFILGSPGWFRPSPLRDLQTGHPFFRSRSCFWRSVTLWAQKKLLGTSASLLGASALLVVTRTLLVTRKHQSTRTFSAARLRPSLASSTFNSWRRTVRRARPGLSRVRWAPADAPGAQPSASFDLGRLSWSPRAPKTAESDGWWVPSPPARVLGIGFSAVSPHEMPDMWRSTGGTVQVHTVTNTSQVSVLRRPPFV